MLEGMAGCSLDDPGFADRILDGEMRQEGVDLRLGHLGGMPNLVEEDEALDPVAVALLGRSAVVAGAERLAEAIEELRLLLGWGGDRPGRSRDRRGDLKTSPRAEGR